MRAPKRAPSVHPHGGPKKASGGPRTLPGCTRSVLRGASSRGDEGKTRRPITSDPNGPTPSLRRQRLALRSARQVAGPVWAVPADKRPQALVQLLQAQLQGVRAPHCFQEDHGVNLSVTRTSDPGQGRPLARGFKRGPRGPSNCASKVVPARGHCFAQPNLFGERVEALVSALQQLPRGPPPLCLLPGPLRRFCPARLAPPPLLAPPPARWKC